MREVTGVHNLTDRADVPPLVPFDEVFTKDQPTDAHYCTYQVFPAQQFPRCNKSVLPQVRAAGAEIISTMLVHEWDTPGHVPWTRELLAAFMAQWSGIVEAWPLASLWTVMHTTRNGARMVYVLDQALPVDVAEGCHVWMVEEFRRRGLMVDSNCSDWTRVFRAPYVLRDNKPTRQDPYAMLARQDACRLPLASLGRLDYKPSSFVSEVREITDPQPDPDQARTLLETVNPTTGRMVMTEWYKAAKTSLGGRECYPCLFERAPLAEKGSRDSTLQKYIGQVIGVMFDKASTTPQHVYALFLPAVEQLQADADTPSWTQSCWSKIRRTWAVHAAKTQQAQVQQAQQQIEALSTIESMARGVGRWAGDGFRAMSVPEQVEWVRSKLIAVCGKSMFVMQKDGSYSPMSLNEKTLVPYIRSLGMEGVVDLQEPKDNGRGFRDVSPQTLLNRHATVVGDVCLRPGIEYSWVERVGTPDAVLNLQGFRLNPNIEPAFDPDVNEWLFKLFGKEHFEKGCKWIGHALDWSGGLICALSIESEGGAGKKMLVQGLAENLAKPAVADAQDIVSDYQYGMADSPFIVVNEGWPRGRGTGMHPADSFRSIVSGDPRRLNRRYMHPVEVKIGYRVIFTANNSSLIEGLGAGRDLSPEDRDALAIRLFHVKSGGEASAWLLRMGGMKFTGSPGRRWISSEGRDDSDFILAKHFRWLYHNRGPSLGRRFLVEGSSEGEVMKKLRTGTGKAPIVIETIIRMVEDPVGTQRPGLVLDPVGRHIYVTSSAVLEYFRTKFSTTRDNLNMAQVDSVLKGLVCEHSNEAGYVHPAKPREGICTWHKIAPETILSEANKAGWKSDRLTSMCSGSTGILQTHLSSGHAHAGAGYGGRLAIN